MQVYAGVLVGECSQQRCEKKPDGLYVMLSGQTASFFAGFI